jgi:hypothetical protein
MPADERVFRIKVCDDHKIRADVRPGADLPACEIGTDPLAQRTIEVLINLLRENRLWKEKEFEVLGDHLYSFLLDNRIGESLHETLGNDSLSLIRVILEFERNQQHLASWPWEYLHYPEARDQNGAGYFLATKTRMVITRRLSLNPDPRVLGVEQERLKVLFVAASLREYEVDCSSVQEAISEIKQKLESRISVIELVEPFRRAAAPVASEARPVATYDRFLKLVETEKPHVIHFVGHGQCTDEGGEIAFVGDDWKADWVRGNDLADDLSDNPGYQSLRLIFLQACESALANPHRAVSSVAMRLAQINIPAVVAMQYKIEQQVANLFAQTFYEALAEPVSIDVAVQRGRRQIRRNYRRQRADQGSRSFAFGLPVLFLRDSGETGCLLSQAVAGAELAAGGSGIGGVGAGKNTPAAWAISADVSASVGDAPPRPIDIPARLAQTIARPLAPTVNRNQSLTDQPQGLAIRGIALVAEQTRCVWCETPAPSDADYCDNCGGEIVCSQCRTPVPGQKPFCRKCGSALQGRRK